MTTIYLKHCINCGKELTDEEKAYSGEHDCVGYLRAELERVKAEKVKYLAALNKIAHHSRIANPTSWDNHYYSLREIAEEALLPAAPEED